MEEMSKHGAKGRAAMSRETAQKQLDTGKLPSEMVKARTLQDEQAHVRKGLVPLLAKVKTSIFYLPQAA